MSREILNKLSRNINPFKVAPKDFSILRRTGRGTIDEIEVVELPNGAVAHVTGSIEIPDDEPIRRAFPGVKVKVERVVNPTFGGGMLAHSTKLPPKYCITFIGERTPNPDVILRKLSVILS